MRKLLLIVGIVSIFLCVLLFIFAVLNLLGYHNLFDGSAGHYNRLHQRMIISFVVGLVFAVIATVCIVIRSKI